MKHKHGNNSQFKIEVTKKKPVSPAPVEVVTDKEVKVKTPSITYVDGVKTFKDRKTFDLELKKQLEHINKQLCKKDKLVYRGLFYRGRKSNNELADVLLMFCFKTHNVSFDGYEANLKDNTYFITDENAKKLEGDIRNLISK